MTPQHDSHQYDLLRRYLQIAEPRRVRRENRSSRPQIASSRRISIPPIRSHGHNASSNTGHQLRIRSSNHPEPRPIQRSRSPPRPSVSTTNLGFLGEDHVWNIFNASLSHWNRHNWTSRNRNGIREGTPFRGAEKSFSDLTYVDARGDMARFFVANGYPEATALMNSFATYHIEVKTTAARRHAPFNLTSNQWDTAKKYAIPASGEPRDVYVIARVYEVGSEDLGVQFFIDPWRMHSDGQLDVKAQTNYQVRPKQISTRREEPAQRVESSHPERLPSRPTRAYISLL